MNLLLGFKSLRCHSKTFLGLLNFLIPELVALDILIKTRKIGRATLYMINKENEFVKQLIKLYDKMILLELDRKGKIAVKV